MPFYEYECSNCKFYVEALQKISDAPLRECPSCKKKTLVKLVSAPVFRLKGSGWYETDFKSDGEAKRNLADRDEPAEKSDDKSESSSIGKGKKVESKPEAAAGKKAEAKAETSAGGKKAESKGKAEVSAGKKAPAKPAPRKAAAAKGKKPAAKPSRAPARKAAPAKKKAKRR